MQRVVSWELLLVVCAIMPYVFTENKTTGRPRKSQEKVVLPAAPVMNESVMCSMIIWSLDFTAIACWLLRHDSFVQ